MYGSYIIIWFYFEICPILNSTRQNKKGKLLLRFTQDFTADELISSESLHVTVCHSSRTNNSLQNQTIFRRKIFFYQIYGVLLLKIYQFLIEYKIKIQTIQKHTHTIMGKIIYYKIYHTYKSYPSPTIFLKIYTTALHKKIWKYRKQDW